jgi:hypothetical protein
MALSEVTKNDKIEVLQLAAGYPVVQVRTATIISRDGEEISRSFHRHVLTPDADLLFGSWGNISRSNFKC